MYWTKPINLTRGKPSYGSLGRTDKERTYLLFRPISKQRLSLISNRRVYMCSTLYHNSVTDVQPTTSSRLSPSEVKVRGSIQETERGGGEHKKSVTNRGPVVRNVPNEEKHTVAVSTKAKFSIGVFSRVGVCVCLKKSIEIYWSWYIFFFVFVSFLILGKVQSISKTVPCFLTLSINYFYFSIYQVNTLLCLGSF